MTALEYSIEAPFGVVDMGSNGIRFGIVTSLKRHLPVAYEERAPISLLEAQGDDHYIPSDTIDAVISSFLRFKTICEHEGVDPSNVRVIATEATRIAKNSQEFQDRIYEATQWKVMMLSKEQEANISSMGIVGSFYKVNGLTMDLGGGSVELSYVTSNTSTLSSCDGDERPRKRTKTSPTPVSLPYGAAVLRQRLNDASQTPLQKSELYDELVEQIKIAKKTANIPIHLRKQSGGYSLYMSGGGFRALGYLSMASKSSKKQNDLLSKKLNYPIPIVSGYSITGKELQKMADKYKDKDPNELVNELKVFRISKRRVRMIPATCFLVSALLQVIPVDKIYFSEGGVRQGLCYELLPHSEQIKDPLIEGVKSYVSHLPYALSSSEYNVILDILKKAIPPLYLSPDHPLQLFRLLPAAVHLANLTTHYPKETRAFVSFYTPLAGGPLANIPGLLHSERAILALILAYRQGGEVPDPNFSAIEDMIGKHGTSVCKYVGRLMEVMFLISPRQPGRGILESGLQFRLARPDSSSEDDEEPMTPISKSFYSSAILEIIFPQKTCQILEAPAVLSVFENMDKKIQPKKFELDQENESLDPSSKLFTVNIIRESSDEPIARNA